jgi:CubicO group peptidase (beta-lactamase class C family)
MVGVGATGVDPQRAEQIVRLGHRYVDEGMLAGTHLLVTRRGHVVVDDVYGMADIKAGRKLADDAVYRIFSMTKPIVSMALMQLFEQGAFLLEDPIGRYLPELDGLDVYVSGDADGFETTEAAGDLTITHLMTHQSGLSASAPWEPPDLQVLPPGWPLPDLAALVTQVASHPLRFQPGHVFDYGISTDIVGRLVEVLSGEPLDQYLQRHILGPLGMVDTGFSVPADQRHRVPAAYMLAGAELADMSVPFDLGERTIVPLELFDSHVGRRAGDQPATYFSGGGGLFSTTADYQRFCELLLGQGERDGVRLIGRKTLELMTMNHLPDNRDLRAHWGSSFTETGTDGVGFGLGFSVVIDVARAGIPCSLGQYGWGGAASTFFWIDPVEQVTALLMTQFYPSSYYPIRRQLQVAVNQALVD